MPREAINASTPYIDASDIWWDIKRKYPSITADEVAREGSGTVKGRLNGIPFAQNIMFDTSACNFGGDRLWLLCADCERRVRILYRPPSRYRFLCRIFNNLSYESCNRSRLERVYPTAILWFRRLHRNRLDVNVV